MPKLMSFSLLSAAAVGLLAAAVPAMAYTGQGLARHAKINLDQARAIALKANPGVIKNEELEYEKGGSGLRYSFVIRQHSHEDGTVMDEVGVDARTGKVLEDKIESQ
jgi:uncharacterized membrane protein YkoI